MDWFLDKLKGLTSSGFPDDQPGAEHSGPNAVLSYIVNGGHSPKLMREMLIKYCDAIVAEHMCLVVSRNLLTSLINTFSTLPDEVALSVSQHLLEALQTRSMSYENQVSSVRMFLVERAERAGDWLAAAELLVKAPMDFGRNDSQAETNLKRCLHAADLFLRSGKSAEAEQCVNRSKRLFADTEQSTEMKTSLLRMTARVLDSLGQFVEAARKYHELCSCPSLSDAERLDCLGKAVRCTILSPVSPQKSRILMQLSKDDRCVKLATYATLKKIFSEQIIPHDSLHTIVAQLDQCCDVVDRRDVSDDLRNAIIEHNFLSASKVYDSISIVELARLLGTTTDIAQETAVRMITENRVDGYIEGLAGFVYFNTDSTLKQYGEHMKHICQYANSVADAISSAHPEWTRQVLDAFAR